MSLDAVKKLVDCSLADAYDIDPEFQTVFLDLLGLIESFVRQRPESSDLQHELSEASRSLAAAICQPGTPVRRGKPASWAAGVMYALSKVNFLQDSSQPLHYTTDDIAAGFGVSKATIYKRGNEIWDGLQLIAFDQEFVLPCVAEMHPELVSMVNAATPEEFFRAALGSVPEGVVEGLMSQLQEELGQAEIAAGDGDSFGDAAPEPQADLAYQFRVALDHVEPPVWRRIVVPDCTLEDFHLFLQRAMGWENCHLFEFESGRERFGLSQEFGEDEEQYDAGFVLLSDILPTDRMGRKKIRLKYTYDFGDDWEHTIELEQIVHDTGEEGVLDPRCLDGERRCPPEDCGGPYRYQRLLHVLAHPEHEDHQKMRNWAGRIDPDDFSPSRTTRQMKRL